MKIKIQYTLSALALSLTLSYGAFAQTTTQSQKFGANPTSIAASAVLEIESSNKGVLFPRVTLSSTSDVTTIVSPATGLTVFNTANAGTSPNNVTPGYYYWNGSKWVKMAVETPYAKTVYVNATSPSTATIFDENNPPATNDDDLKSDDVNLYIGNNGSTWTYNTSTSAYNTFIVPASTPFNLAGTTTDAGSNKTSAIDRTGSLSVTNGFLRASGNSNSFTIDPTQGGGPRLMLGTTVAPNSYFELGAYNSINNFDTKARDFNIFSTASANALFLKHNTGNVGLGTNAPTQRLDVNGTGLFRRGNSTGATTSNQILFGFNGESTYQHAIKTRHTAGAAQGNAIDFYVWTNAVDLNAVASRHLMSLEGQGRVGIGGITNPTAVIDAASTSVATNTLNADRKMLRLSIPTNPSVKVGNVAEFNMGSYSAGGSAFTRLDLALNNGGDNTVSQVMTWQANGNVGIGTTAPANKLEITQGTAGNSGLRFTNLTSASAAATSSNKVLTLNNTGDVILANVPGTQNIVTFTTATPSTSGVVFSPNTPSDESVIYQSDIDNSLWTYNGTSYVTYNPPASTAWNLAGTTNDAGNNKTAAIWREGNVGIGTNTPNATLEVSKINTSPFQSIVNVASNPAALAEGGFNALNPNITKASSGIQFLGWNGKKEGGIFRQTGNSDKSHLMFTVNNANDVAMTINESLNVGIGTNAPSNKLEVVGTGETSVSNATARISNYSALATGNFAGLMFKANNIANEGSWKIGSKQENATEASDQNFHFTNSYNGSSYASRMMITPEGNVGLGSVATSGFTPLSTLHVQSPMQATNTVNADANVLRLSRPPTGNIKWDNIAQFNLGSYAIAGTSTNEARTRLDLRMNDGSDATTFNNVMTWNANGNVGIGTTAPTQRLHIKGTNAQPATTGTVSNAILRIDGSSSHALDIGTYTNVPYGAYLQSITTSDLTTKLPLVLNPTGGNVGIGINNPAHNLSVLGNARIQPNTSNNGTGEPVWFEMYGKASGGTDTQVGGIKLGWYDSFGGIEIVRPGSSVGVGLAFNYANTNPGTTLEGFRLTSAGNVGIGTTAPSTRLHVSGSVTATSYVTSSDARLKSNIINLSQGLTKIMQLKPVNYDKKEALDSAATVNENGFIAQELQKIMPELVSEGKDKDKLLSVNYTAIIPVLTKAVQEQQAIIEKQQTQINELKALLEKVLNNK